jgi:hypothetical protein
MGTPPTPRDYHHPSSHDSLLRIVVSWMASTPASEDWRSAHVKFKILLTLICWIQPNGSFNSSNRWRKWTRCWSNSTTHRWPTSGPWDTILDHMPRASLEEDPYRGTLYLFHLFNFCIYFMYLFIYLSIFKKEKNQKIKNTKNMNSTLICVLRMFSFS